MKRLLLLLVVLLAFLSAFHVWQRMQRPATAASETESVTVNGKPLEIEFARTPEAITQGLSDRQSMPAGHGMLFVFDNAGDYPFWMNRMHFPLDIIWFQGGRVVDVVTLPPPGIGQVPAIHDPGTDADRVLEVNAGEATGYGLRVGAHVDAIANQW